MLVAGGGNAAGSLSSSEAYDPKGNAWLSGPDLGSVNGPATQLSNGRILFAGDGTPGSAGLVTAPK